MSGLNTITKMSDPPISGICWSSPSRERLSHIPMKKRTRKKSLSGVSLEVSCIRNGEVANDIPARRHPVSNENQTSWKQVPSIRQYHIPTSTKNSCSVASHFTTLGRTYFAMSTTRHSNTNPSKNKTLLPHSQLPDHCKAISIITSITTRSWTMRIHIEIFP